MKANGSRREEGGKNITEKIRCVPRSGEKNSRSDGGAVGVGSVDAGGGRWAGTRARSAPAGEARMALTLAAAPSLVARVLSAAPSLRASVRAAGSAPRDLARTCPLHVQSAKVSAPRCYRESDPAADLRDGPELHAAQG